MNSETIETIGNITKSEMLTSCTEGRDTNLLVLHSHNSFPGISNLNKKNENLQRYYLALRYRYAHEKISRLNSSIAERYSLSHTPASCELIMSKEIMHGIRFKNLSIEEILSFRSLIKEHNVELMTYRVFDYHAIVQVYKMFKLIETITGLYRDLADANKFYITIPKSINWKRFTAITEKIRGGLEDKDFDAALGMIYRYYGTEDIVRIYDNDKSATRAVELKQKFTKEIHQDLILRNKNLKNIIL